MRIPRESCYYGLVIRFPLLSTRGYCPDAVTFSYWPLSAGQVEDLHLAVKMRFQAHWHAPLALEFDGPTAQRHSRLTRFIN